MDFMGSSNLGPTVGPDPQPIAKLLREALLAICCSSALKLFSLVWPSLPSFLKQGPWP